MVEWFFLHRVHAITTGSTVGGQYHAIVEPPAHKTQASLPFVQPAKTRAEIALNSTVIKQMPVTYLETLILINRKVCHSQLPLF